MGKISTRYPSMLNVKVRIGVRFITRARFRIRVKIRVRVRIRKWLWLDRY